MVIRGREITQALLGALQEQAASLSLRKLGRWLCEHEQWKGPGGKWQISVAIEVLGLLKARGLLRLPEVSQPSIGRPGRVVPPKQIPMDCPKVLCAELEELQPVELVQVGSRWSKHYQIWRQLLDQHHYLRSGPLCGPQLRYLVRSHKHGWLGALAFSAAARRLAGRDQWIGWDQEARRENLPWVINNSRFLILPQVKVANLASHVLAQATAVVAEHWEERFGYRPVLVESFVELGAYKGTCYQAANWQVITMSSGRGRQDRHHRRALSRKIFLVYPLQKNFREQLCQLPLNRRLVSLPQRLPAPRRAPQNWLEEEFGRSELKDQRLEKRLRMVAGDFYARPLMNIPQACGSRAKTKAVYRFFDHPRVNLQSVLNGHYQATTQRAGAHKVVLAVQDTTDLNYSAHPATEGLGPICDKETVIGLMVHDTMTYNLEGTPLGLIDVQCWARDPEQLGKRQQREQLAIEQKESSKWLVSYQAARQLQERCPESTVVSVGDREADVYELFVQAREHPTGPKLLVRARQDRRLQDEETSTLWEFVQQQPLAGHVNLKVPRRGNRPARQALLEVRFTPVKLCAPKRKPTLGPSEVWAIQATEIGAPEGVEAIDWRLLTTLAVENLDQAVEKLQWYALRFQIEVYHRTLKSGCKIEDRQLGNAERIEGCLAVDMVVAWRIAHLTKLGREVPEVPCTVYFEEVQWQALVAFVTGDPMPPKEPPTLREAVRMLAMRLGGFLGRKSDGEPGTETVWRGLQRLDDITEMWCVFQGRKWIPPTTRELLDSS